MIIGVAREIKKDESRVALTPAGTEMLRKSGHTVWVEDNAGAGSGFPNESYVKAGAEVIMEKKLLFEKADMIMKVKEPLPPEYGLFRPGQILFTYLHLAPELELTRSLLEKKVIGIAYETIEGPSHTLPLLSP